MGPILTQPDETPVSPFDHEITEAMIVHGGGFVGALGALFRRADDINRRRLREAFPEYWEEYRSIAELAALRRVK